MPSGAHYMNVGQAAEHLSVSPSYLNKLRLRGGGPRFAKIGRRVAYDIADLIDWVESRKCSSTSEH